MPRTSERGGPATRARISQVATGLFLEHGFDRVTVAEVARAAGVSSVTVFNHFPRKEDLLLDRSADAEELLLAAVRHRDAGVDVLSSLQQAVDRLAAERHALSGLAEGSVPFFRTVAGSPALLGRAREIAAALQQLLTDELRRDPSYTGDPVLLAAFFVAGYATVLIGTAQQLMAGAEDAEVATDHRGRLQALFIALREGLMRRP